MSNTTNPMGFIGNLYKWIWTRIGGRPYTYVIRDFCYQNPLLLILITLMVVLCFLHMKHEVLWVLGGILLGHLFWGTRWIPGQEGDKPNSKLKRLIGK